MPLQVARVRRWFAAAILAAIAAVGGAYFYAQHRVQNALKQVPEKIGLEIEQSANGFSISRSEGGRTLFKLQAQKAIKFKQGGHSELHDVVITLYGRDSSRYDQIYGSDFEYDPTANQVNAKGEVQIDLEANPAGLASPDQATPKELKNPIHLETSGLVFNQKTGDAYTNEKVQLRTPQASGSAVGISYTARSRTLILKSQVAFGFGGANPVNVTADRGTITKTPRAIVLEDVRLTDRTQRASANRAELILRPDNALERLRASGDVQVAAQGSNPIQLRADAIELIPASEPNTVRSATLQGNVRVWESSTQGVQGNAGRAVLDFAAGNVLTKVHAEESVRLQQKQRPAGEKDKTQNVELSAPAVDFFLAGGKHLERAKTTGGAQIVLTAAGQAGVRTLITAAEFEARFNALGQIASLHGVPEARIVSASPGQPDRVSTSESLDASFGRDGGIESVAQQGNVAYADSQLKAWAAQARHTTADQMIALSGQPRIVEGAMTATSRSMLINRQTGDAVAEGNIKCTYSDLKPQPGGALLSSASPIHVTAEKMSVQRQSDTATYTGHVRLWQDANVVQAPAIEFNRDQRAIRAYGGPGGAADHSVSTVLVQADKSGKVTPIAVESSRLSYSDNEHRVRLEGGVEAKAPDFTVTAKEMEILLEPRGPSDDHSSPQATGRLDRVTAEGGVLITQPSRRATGERLVYTAAEDKFVLTGGPPSIFDAEHGKITGDSLTLFRADDRVLVEGTVTSPSVTQTRVAR